MGKATQSVSPSYFYSASTFGFYPISLKSDYEMAGSWPSDAVAVVDEDLAALQAGHAAGKKISANSEGYPILSEPEPLTPEQLQRQALDHQSELMNEATNAIAPLQDAVDLQEATDDELILLNKWKQYRVTLNRLDLSNAPEVNWPVAPEVK